MDQSSQARIVEEALFEALRLMAKSEGVVLPARGTTHDVEAAVGAVIRVSSLSGIFVRASSVQGRARLTISTTWPAEKVEEIVRLVNLDDEREVFAEFVSPELIIDYVGD